jgi:ADP-ribose pyrophosphatase YjhB (NUDIX family)
MPTRNAHCSYCGHRFDDDASWPRKCGGCSQVSYVNPIPVAVVLLPVDTGLLAIRRTIEPHRGELALPGGFINLGESWQAAAARELFEETGIAIDPAELTVFDVKSAPDSTLLVFGLAHGRTRAELPSFSPNDEASECVVLTSDGPLAFPLHTEIVRAYLARR